MAFGLDPIVDSLFNQLKINVKSEIGIDLEIVEGRRSPERQQELFEQGRTTPGNIVTNAKAWESWHQYGLAFDVAPVDPTTGRWPWWEAPNQIWSQIGFIGQNLGLTWGASFGDRPHFEYHPGLTLNEVKRFFLETGEVLVSKTIGSPWNLILGFALIAFVIFAQRELKL